jgi:hypothetical protein
MRALEIFCRLLAAVPYIAAALCICVLWALSVPLVWLIGLGKGGDK